MNAVTEAKPALGLRNLWYFAALSREVASEKLCRKIILGEPIVLGRTRAGELFALRDICPHRGVPLSAGKMLGDVVQCAYHGWRFKADGQCTHIPSLVDGQEMDIARIRVRSYPLSEANGLIWIFLPEEASDRTATPTIAAPQMPIPSTSRPALIESQIFPCEVDHAVVGLMDPAHGPFVHSSWWWRGKTKPYPKAKTYAPSELGFTMVGHPPSTNSLLYKILGGGLVTEISFRLPGIRVEHIKAGKRWLVGLTTVTPREDKQTEVSQIFFWSMPWLSLLKPVLKPIARTFLGQDRGMVVLQQEGLRFNPSLMLIRDADVPAMWYYRIKKEWADATANRRPFVNPVAQSVLRWKS
jgi:phenylpropionate dioxygenase-like ring-hydroxylating dioxygenase large terminal subunit